ncbi:ABC transporter substrate-binding protein [Streptomyces sp. NPDC057638]|uniref:ABC transporter substrate-binding protein n=1 Tax=Streptomyces sp. NPDC057638 TaxID=3346190 RepID=UPI00367561FA
MAAFDDVQTSDPHRAYETGSRNLVANVYETLLDIDPETGGLRPKLASLTPSNSAADEPVYRFRIRPGVLFHDGSQLTTGDVVYSLRRLLLLGTGAGVFWREALLGRSAANPARRDLVAAAKRIGAEGDTVIVTLPLPYSPFLQLVATYAYILPAAWCAHSGDWSGSLDEAPPEHSASAVSETANGTGPYRLASWNRSDRTLRFRLFADYWGPSPLVEHIVYTSVDDRLEREAALIEGTVDFAVCQGESVSRLGHGAGIHIAESSAEWSVNPLGLLSFDLAHDPDVLGSGEFSPSSMPSDALRDPHLRAALSHCFDHDRFEREALAGRGIRHHGLFPRTALPNGPRPPDRYDLAMARKHLEKAADGAIKSKGVRIVSYTHRGNLAREQAADILADGFNRLHPSVRLEVRATTLQDLMDRLEGRRCPIGWIGWASDFCHPHASVSPFLASAWPLARGLSIASPGTEAAVEAALRSQDETAAQRIYQQLARTVVDERLMLFVPSKVNYRVYRSAWSGIDFVGGRPNVLDFARFRWNTS